MLVLVFSALTLVAQVTPASSPGATSPAASPSAPPAAPIASPSPVPSASPALQLSVPAVNLHPTQSGTIQVTRASGTISAQVSAPLITLHVDQSSGTITVAAGTQTGTATLTVTDASGATVSVPVRVAFDAAAVPAAITLRVTGTDVDPAWLATQIQNVLRQSVQRQPAAGPLQLGAIAAPSPFSAGASAVASVPVQVAGGDRYFDVSTNVTVNVQNVPVSVFEPPLLFYDDDPEKIAAEGVLYRNQVAQTTPVRLYYYHENTGAPRTLQVVLRALNAPATVQLIDASAGPNPDVMTVGHNVSRDFLLRKTRNQGVLVDLSPGVPYVAEQFGMQPLDGAAGSIGMRVLSGGPIQLAVVALPAGDDLPGAIAAAFDQLRLPGDGHARTGVFNLSGYGVETLTYTVGGADAMTDYGASTPPPVDPPGGHDYGDYGVIRTLTFSISNPTSQPATLYLYERPMGGPVRSSFLVDGTLVQVGCARVPERYQIGTPFAVSPSSTAQLVVQTMTDGGSNYPLEVGLTATPPIPTTPPISAPTGCFPKP